MIFSDQETASFFRQTATEQLYDDIAQLVRDCVEHGIGADAIDIYTVKQYMERGDIRARLWKVLLWRSGIIHATRHGNVHDCVLFHDNDTDYTVSAELRKIGMVGGIDVDTGQTHT